MKLSGKKDLMIKKSQQIKTSDVPTASSPTLKPKPTMQVALQMLMLLAQVCDDHTCCRSHGQRSYGARSLLELKQFLSL